MAEQGPGRASFWLRPRSWPRSQLTSRVELRYLRYLKIVFTLSVFESEMIWEWVRLFSVWCLHQATSDAAFARYKKSIAFAFVFAIAQCRCTLSPWLLVIRYMLEYKIKYPITTKAVAATLIYHISDITSCLVMVSHVHYHQIHLLTLSFFITKTKWWRKNRQKFTCMKLIHLPCNFW